MVYGDMVASEETLLQQMVEMIVCEVTPEIIILFGSHTRDDALPDSDFDLLVVGSRTVFAPAQSSQGDGAPANGAT
ncbi:MAG: nucleotidyltransferase domain-containing protein [Candidatus Nitrotoga sp.]|nr:nucleotidyltransferase domain-containing protein [Candidatus Nitrotoga sp.]